MLLRVAQFLAACLQDEEDLLEHLHQVENGIFPQILDIGLAQSLEGIFRKVMRSLDLLENIWVRRDDKGFHDVSSVELCQLDQKLLV